MLRLRTLDTLGGGNRDRLKARHHFAVDSQGNRKHARLGNLLVCNDDGIAPRSGFPMHGIAPWRSSRPCAKACSCCLVLVIDDISSRLPPIKYFKLSDLQLAQELHPRCRRATNLMLKVQRTANGEVVFAVSGQLEAEGLRELSTLLELEPSTRAVTLELKDLVIVDRDAVAFLRACAEKGIELRNCPQYIRTWMASDGDPK
jgi:hypothetical protein